jgi:hypothetical protein
MCGRFVQLLTWDEPYHLYNRTNPLTLNLGPRETLRRRVQPLKQFHANVGLKPAHVQSDSASATPLPQGAMQKF